jgi:hypothetical protein
MKKVLLATCLFLSSNAFAQKTKIAACKAVTPGLVAYPGDPNDVKNTVVFGEAVELSQDTATVNSPVLIAEIQGQNTYNKPVSKTLEAPWASAFGGDYYSFSVSAADPNDQVPYVRLEVEFLDNSRKKLLLSILVTENVKANGKNFKRYYTTRYKCDSI